MIDQSETLEHTLANVPSTLNSLFRKAIARFPDTVAFRTLDETLTFAEIGKRATGLASFLHSVGLSKGDRVAVMLPNCTAFPVSSIAIAFAGLVQVNVNPMYTAPELHHQLRDSGARAIVIDESAISVLASIIADLPIEIVIVTGDLAGPLLMPSARVIVGFTAALATIGQKRFPEADPDDIALLQYTGGTTGRSKGAVLRHRNIVINSAQVWDAISAPLTVGNETILTALPLYHIFAFTVNFVTFFSKGATNVLVRNPSNAEELFDALTWRSVTAITGVNTLFANLISHYRATEIDWSQMKLAIGGGSAILPITSESWKSLTGSHILEGYGMTETSPVLTTNRPGDAEFSGTVGLPLTGTRISIFNAQDQELGPGETGEVCILGPQVMSGYWGQPTSQDTFNPAGYLRSGDIGFFDPQGRLRLIDRRKDMILVSGFNVYPNEVEAAASAFENVMECACIGLPHERTGETVALFIVCKPGTTIEPEALRQFCATQLAPYKVPRKVELISSLPKSTVGKILRWKLRESTIKA